MGKKSLQSVEFIAPLARIDPVYKEEEEAFKVRSLQIAILDKLEILVIYR
jgi:hypothetical protein